MLYIRSDSSSACNQITRVDEAQVICVMNTTLGLFEIHRLPRGIKHPSGMFKRTVEISFENLAGTICVQDDLMVQSITEIKMRREGQLGLA